MFLVGLTGGIATGKSTVSSILQSKYKCHVIDADKIARDGEYFKRQGKNNVDFL